MRAFFCLLILLAFFVRPASGQASPGPANGFAVKGYHIDLRIQVIRMPALKAFVQKLKNGGINTLIMEWEATYPFEKYPVIANQYAYTKEEVGSFMRFCDSLQLDVIPLQQSFGHVEYILRNYRFAALREDERDYSQVCPSEAVADRTLFTDLFKELVKTHKSPYFHIGGDETYLLGHCEKCRKKAQEEGLSKLYIDYVRMLCEIVIGLGKKPVLWADIALKHPEAIKLLPEGTVFIDWNYGWELNRFGNLDNLLKSGYEIWGAPSIRSGADNYYLSQWDVHFSNLHDFIPAARRLGYKGMVLTSWATNGIFNPIFNSGFDIIDLYPRGHRYPFTGYNMLLEAFFESLQTPAPLDMEAFAVRYAKETFGFAPEEARELYGALRTSTNEIRQNVVFQMPGLSVEQVLDSARRAARVLHRLKPLKGGREYAHLLLLADIRIQYLDAYVVENRLNSGAYNKNEYPKLAVRLKEILLRSDGLDKRFIALNKDTFYMPELLNENRIRRYHIQLLYNRVSGHGRTLPAARSF